MVRGQLRYIPVNCWGTALLNRVYVFSSARQVSLTTAPKYDYDKIVYRVATITSFVFKVRAKSDAHIVLWQHYHADKAYEIVIGMSSNTYTAIRKLVSVDLYVLEGLG